MSDDDREQHDTEEDRFSSGRCAQATFECHQSGRHGIPVHVGKNWWMVARFANRRADPNHAKGKLVRDEGMG